LPWRLITDRSGRMTAQGGGLHHSRNRLKRVDLQSWHASGKGGKIVPLVEFSDLAQVRKVQPRPRIRRAQRLMNSPPRATANSAVGSGTGVYRTPITRSAVPSASGMSTNENDPRSGTGTEPQFQAVSSKRAYRFKLVLLSVTGWPVLVSTMLIIATVLVSIVDTST